MIVNLKLDVPVDYCRKEPTNQYFLNRILDVLESKPAGEECPYADRELYVGMGRIISIERVSE